ncbi:MAG: NAD(P)/FAD-dependent oxidoreductase [Polyangiales bacterium]
MTFQRPRIGIIGAGPSGIACGHELLEQGFTNFTLLEALDAPGGTWQVQSYPGLACDVWAHSYSFSYAPNPDWSANFVERAEIQAYLAKCWADFGLKPHTRFNTSVASAHWQDESYWLVRTATGETFEFDVLVNAMGNQHTPLYPDVPGRDRFRGPSWHAARWDHDVDLTGKRVAVVGSAASAVQIVPEVAKVARHLTVLQRSANWIVPRHRKLYSGAQRWRFRQFPWLIGLTRRIQGFLMGQVQYAATIGHPRMRHFEWFALRYLERAIDDPVLRAQLTPDTRYACKRGLVSDDFYPALTRDNVELVASALQEVTDDGLITADNRHIELDAIVYCTGYRILDLDRIDVVGTTGQSIAEAMGDAPKAYKGIATPGFPNYFFAVGPNGLVLDVPYFKTAERNVKTIVGLLQQMRTAGITAIDVRQSTTDAYFTWMSTQFPRFSWGSRDCHSYYTNAAGHAPFLFPGNFEQFLEFHNEIGLQDFNVIGGTETRNHQPNKGEPWIPSPARQQ